MKIYRAIKFNKETPNDKVYEFAALFSERTQIISKKKKTFVCIRYNPDTYLKNQEQIGIFYNANFFKPLVMTNYKFLALLLKISNEDIVSFKNFSFYNGDSEEGEIDKEEIESQINQGRDIDFTFDFLEEADQRIKYVELHLGSSKNKVRIYASGNIGLSENFDPEYNNYILDMVEFLFIGRNSR